MKALFLTWLALIVVCQAEVIRDISYAGDGGHRHQKLDLYLPEEVGEKPKPVFVLIHGGSWSAGDKANSDFIGLKAPWLIKSGYLVASVNYRLSPEVMHPGHIEDVCKAIGWLEKNISLHGGDPQRLYLLGYSASAHLAALAVVDNVRLQEAGVDPSVIRGAVLLDGAGYDIPRLYALLPENSKPQIMYRTAFSDESAKQRDASPVHRMVGEPPPFLILHVAARPSAAFQSRLLAKALTEKGGRAVVTAISGKSHSTINKDCGKPGDPVTEAIEAFLR